MLASQVIPAVCAQVEAAFRNGEDPAWLQLPVPVFLSLRLHQINAFGYRAEWAQDLLGYVRFTSEGRPYFPVSPTTPEAHRHKFLCALTLSEGSPGAWKVQGRAFVSEDFVGPILDSPVEDWGDRSQVPEPSWTLQFLSAFLDETGHWQGRKNRLASVAQAWWERYFQDFASGELWQSGGTPFTESGLHFLEAANKLCRRQSRLAIPRFSELKTHLWTRLQKTTAEASVLLGNPDWMIRDYGPQALEIAISQLLVLGHALEIAFHPQGALLRSWEEFEIQALEKAAQDLAKLMGLFFDPRILGLMDEVQRQSYPFPLLHAYHALVLGGGASGPA